METTYLNNYTFHHCRFNDSTTSRSNQYKRYTADEALQIILSPGDDSELSGLDDDENEEIEYEVVPEQKEEVVIEQVQQFEEERFPSS